jgi:hypothetical protein
MLILLDLICSCKYTFNFLMCNYYVLISRFVNQFNCEINRCVFVLLGVISF